VFGKQGAVNYGCANYGTFAAITDGTANTIFWAEQSVKNFTGNYYPLNSGAPIYPNQTIGPGWAAAAGGGEYTCPLFAYNWICQNGVGAEWLNYSNYDHITDNNMTYMGTFLVQPNLVSLSAPNAASILKPSTFHGAMNTLFGDGSVHSISGSISVTAWDWLLT